MFWFQNKKNSALLYTLLTLPPPIGHNIIYWQPIRAISCQQSIKSENNVSLCVMFQILMKCTTKGAKKRELIFFIIMMHFLSSLVVSSSRLLCTWKSNFKLYFAIWLKGLCRQLHWRWSRAQILSCWASLTWLGSILPNILQTDLKTVHSFLINFNVIYIF